MKVNIGNFPEDDTVEREISVEIEKHDLWSLDHTLSLIIAPALKKFKEASIETGHPCFGNPVENTCSNCTCSTQWVEILDKMIFAFDSLNSDYQEQYYSGEVDMQFTNVDRDGNETPDGEFRRMDKGPNDTFKVDSEGLELHEKKIQEGLELFGKYFRNLWV